MSPCIKQALWVDKGFGENTMPTKHRHTYPTLSWDAINANTFSPRTKILILCFNYSWFLDSKILHSCDVIMWTINRKCCRRLKYVTQYNKRYILSSFEKIEIFALSNRRFNKLSNDSKFIKIEVILLKIQVWQSLNFLLFSLYFTHCFVHYLRINLADKMYLLLYWVTY